MRALCCASSAENILGKIVTNSAAAVAKSARANAWVEDHLRRHVGIGNGSYRHPSPSTAYYSIFEHKHISNAETETFRGRFASPDIKTPPPVLLPTTTPFSDDDACSCACVLACMCSLLISPNTFSPPDLFASVAAAASRNVRIERARAFRLNFVCVNMRAALYVLLLRLWAQWLGYSKMSRTHRIQLCGG